MARPVTLFKARPAGGHDWTNQEIAEFYRVEAALTQAGIRIFSDRGQSDEGDPWFVFCRAPEGEVVIHFARLGGDYLIASETFPEILRGHDFRALINRFANQNPSLVALPPSPLRGRLFLHPSALLAAIVATAFFWMNPQDAVAGEMDADSRSEIDGVVLHQVASTALTGLDGSLQETNGKIEGGEEHPQSRHLVLILSIMTMAATFDWVSDHAIVNLVDDWIANDIPVEQRVAYDRLYPVLLALDSSDEAVSHKAEFARSGLDKTGVLLDEPSAYTAAQELAATTVAREDDARRLIDQTMTIVVDKPDNHGSTALDGDDTLWVTDSTGRELSGASLRLVLAAPEAHEDSAKGLTTDEGLSNPDGVSHALTFILHEAQELKIDLPIKALEVQQDLIVYDENSLYGLIQRVNEIFDGSQDDGSVIFAGILNPLLVDGNGNDAGSIVAGDGLALADTFSSIEHYGDQMELLVQAFLKSSPTVEVFVVDGNVVLLEADQTRYAEDGFGVMSWAMDDGSTLSIIGVLSDLPVFS